jgi:hypothetical protein
VTRGYASSLIYGDMQNMPRVRHKQEKIQFVSPGNDWRTESIVLDGPDVHTFLEGLELMESREYSPIL